jgi:hypothetical protein
MKNLVRKIFWADRLARRETMITRQDSDQWFTDQDLIGEIRVPFLGPHESRVQLPGRETIGELR